MADDTAKAGPGSATDAIQAIVDPIRAAGALIGFAVGAYATHASGGATSDAILHGLLGAVLVFPLAWFLALFIVRESIRANVKDQRADYEARVVEARIQVADRLRASGTPLAPGLEESLRGQLPPGNRRS